MLSRREHDNSGFSQGLRLRLVWRQKRAHLDTRVGGGAQKQELAAALQGAPRRVFDQVGALEGGVQLWVETFLTLTDLKLRRTGCLAPVCGMIRCPIREAPGEKRVYGTQRMVHTSRGCFIERALWCHGNLSCFAGPKSSALRPLLGPVSCS